MFMIVTKNDFPVYDLPLDNLVRSSSSSAHLYEFIMNAALDPVEEI